MNKLNREKKFLRGKSPDEKNDKCLIQNDRLNRKQVLGKKNFLFEADQTFNLFFGGN